MKSVIVCRWSTFPLLFLDGLVWVISRRTLHWEDGEAGSHSLWPFQTSWGQPAENKKMPISNHPIKRVTCPSYWSLRRCCRSTSILSISTPINFAETYKFVQMKLISICLSEDLIIPQTQLTTSKTPSCSNGRKINWTFFSWFGGSSPIFWRFVVENATNKGWMMLASRTPFSWSLVAAYFTAALVLTFRPLNQFWGWDLIKYWFKFSKSTSPQPHAVQNVLSYCCPPCSYSAQ